MINRIIIVKPNVDDPRFGVLIDRLSLWGRLGAAIGPARVTRNLLPIWEQLGLSGGSPPRNSETTDFKEEALRKGYALHKQTHNFDEVSLMLLPSLARFVGIYRH